MEHYQRFVGRILEINSIFTGDLMKIVWILIKKNVWRFTGHLLTRQLRVIKIIIINYIGFVWRMTNGNALKTKGS